MVVNKLLRTMGYTWLDWGKACQDIIVPAPETPDDYQNTIIRETIEIYQSQTAKLQQMTMEKSQRPQQSTSPRKPQTRQKKLKIHH